MVLHPLVLPDETQLWFCILYCFVSFLVAPVTLRGNIARTVGS